MRKYLLIPIAILFTVSACNQAEVDRMTSQNDSLRTVINAGDASLNELLTSFNDIEANLDSVAAKQGIITKDMDASGELKRSAADKINAQINDINALMNENRKKISELNQKLKKSGRSSSQLKKSIALLKNRIESKDKELSELNERLTTQSQQIVQLTGSVDSLRIAGDEKTAIIEEQTAQMNTAYYVVGNNKTLSEAKVIDRTGGFIGIGRTSSLSENVDHSNFTKVDVTNIKYIPVHGKRVKLITKHPSESYSLEYDETNEDLVKGIAITSEEQFWSVSNYLVVQKD